MSRVGMPGRALLLLAAAMAASEPARAASAYWLSKDDGVTSVMSGGQVVYTIVVKNMGGTLESATVTDNMPPGLSNVSWNCVASGGAQCPAPAFGTGSFSAGVTVPNGDMVVFTVTATVSAPPGGTLTNTATVMAMTSSDHATDTDTISAMSMGSGVLVRYAVNLNVGDSVINMTNSGASTTNPGFGDAANGFQQSGQLCANVYAYSPDEQLVSCCSCNVTPNGLNSLSVVEDLASNTLTPIIPSALVIKIVASAGGAACLPTSAATVTKPDLRKGLFAWGSTIHEAPVTVGTPTGTYLVTETPFAVGQLNEDDLRRSRMLCAFIRATGAGYGICKSCKIGGLGAAKK